ncbi:MAG TPA: HEAT repeat domain-containing protein, partial [Chryseosolibacter sp.]|nr:HEAT repeat domain-containing protein [Chryseosolibacter sp.]
REQIAELSTHVWKFPRLASKVVACLGKIGDPSADCELLARFLEHPVYQVRFQAVSALRKLGDEGNACLTLYSARSRYAINNIINHFSEPLLQ